MTEEILKKLGFSEKAVRIYLTLLKDGPTSLRRLAEMVDINRGTVHNVLKELKNKQLVSFYVKHKMRHYIAADPETLLKDIQNREDEIKKVKQDFKSILPELKSLYNDAGGKPKTCYYEGARGVKIVLDDLLETLEKSREKVYQVYSTKEVRSVLYQCYPGFTKQRIKNKIKVKVIAHGAGGRLCGLDERKWLGNTEMSPTYILIFGEKVAMITKHEQKLVTVLIDNKNIADTQKNLFYNLWQRL